MKFEQALEAVGEWEGVGKFTDDPNDPGGATKSGITKATLERWRGRPVTKAEVEALEWSECVEIYRAFYWQAAKCDVLPPLVRLAVFDCAVNQGVGRAVRILQAAAGVKVDGVAGPKTMGAANTIDSRILLRDFMARRAVHYSSLANIVRYGYGWFRRMFDIHRRSYESFLRR